MNLLLVGRYPPPYGGVTVHVQRLAEASRRRGITCRVLDLYAHTPIAGAPPYVTVVPEAGWRRYPALLHAVRGYDVDIVHLHASNMDRLAYVAPVLWRQLRARKRVLTIHHGNFDRSYAAHTPLVRSLIRRTLAAADAVIFPTADLEARVMRVLGSSIRHSAVASTFVGFEQLARSEHFAPLAAFQRRLAEEHPDVVATLLISGYGFDYYGFRLLLDAVHRLSAQGLHLAVIISFYGSGDAQFMTALVDDMQQAVPTLVVRDLSPQDFACVLAAADVYVRPTTVDSCGVTVYEALAVGTPCVASDVCSRPPGTILHKSGDVASLAQAIAEAVGGLGAAAQLPMHMEGGEAVVFALYDSLLASATLTPRPQATSANNG